MFAIGISNETKKGQAEELVNEQVEQMSTRGEMQTFKRLETGMH